jgi:REP element-mobilizing transposase RayT
MTTVGWIDVFTRKRYRDILIDSFRYCQENKGLILYAYVIMSNHLHCIARAEEPHRLSDVIRDFKKFTASRIIESISEAPESRRDWLKIVMEYYARFNKNNSYFQFWQNGNRPMELFSPTFIYQKLNYIHDNPVVAGWVERPEHYLYSSASNYLTGTGLLDVELIDVEPTVGYIFMGG